MVRVEARVSWWGVQESGIDVITVVWGEKELCAATSFILSHTLSCMDLMSLLNPVCEACPMMIMLTIAMLRPSGQAK